MAIMKNTGTAYGILTSLSDEAQIFITTAFFKIIVRFHARFSGAKLKMLYYKSLYIMIVPTKNAEKRLIRNCRRFPAKN
jgi:uncharacterized protein YktA (UPF0223 family)